MTKELFNNRTAATSLCAAFVAAEGYFLYSILGTIIPQFWLSNVIMYMISVFAAYFIMDAIAKRDNTDKRKKAIAGVVILAVTVVAAITLSVIALYLSKLQIQSTFN